MHANLLQRARIRTVSTCNSDNCYCFFSTLLRTKVFAIPDSQFTFSNPIQALQQVRQQKMSQSFRLVHSSLFKWNVAFSFIKGNRWNNVFCLALFSRSIWYKYLMIGGPNLLVFAQLANLGPTLVRRLHVVSMLVRRCSDILSELGAFLIEWLYRECECVYPYVPWSVFSCFGSNTDHSFHIKWSFSDNIGRTNDNFGHKQNNIGHWNDQVFNGICELITPS